MTTFDGKAFGEEIVAIFKQKLDSVINPLLTRLDEIDARVSKAENQARSMRYSGVYDPETKYFAGNFVTSNGSLWTALRENKGERPGECDAWQLAVKRGRDGKDAR